MPISESKTKLVIDNYFKKECSVNTSIYEAFEKGFRIGIKKGYDVGLRDKNVEKIGVSYKSIDLSFEEITLLSKKEYFEHEKIIPLIKDGWWLRSPGLFTNNATLVFGGSGVALGSVPVHREFGVRPALRIRNCYNLIPGDKIRISEYIFTILNENLALCDTCVGKSIFNHETNNFENSVIRKYLYD